MNDLKKKISFDELNRLAAAATDDVRAQAVKSETLLPVWKDDRVMYEHPTNGSTTTAEDGLKKLMADLGATTAKSNG